MVLGLAIHGTHTARCTQTMGIRSRERKDFTYVAFAPRERRLGSESSECAVCDVFMSYRVWALLSPVIRLPVPGIIVTCLLGLCPSRIRSGTNQSLYTLCRGPRTRGRTAREYLHEYCMTFPLARHKVIQTRECAWMGFRK